MMALSESPVDCTLCANEFGRYAVPISSKHRLAAQAVLNGEVWERETIEFMRSHTGGRDIVHAGTYFGDFLPALSAALQPSRTLYAFEPNSENFHCAEWTVLLNGLNNVRLQQMGLADTNSQRRMQTISAKGRPLGGASYITTVPAGPTEDITAVRLDDALPSSADIGVLQLDVESFEEPALKGALETIARCRPILILESVPQPFVNSHITPLGYRRTGDVCGNAIFTV